MGFCLSQFDQKTKLGKQLAARVLQVAYLRLGKALTKIIVYLSQE